MKDYLFLSIFLFCSCTHNQGANVKLTLEKECENSIGKDSIQCKIAYEDGLSLDEKQQLLGMYYLTNSIRTEEDCKKSKYWFNQSASRNNPEALDGLGMLYFSGCGVDKNFQKAEEYFLSAYDNHSRQAAANLGNVYVLGGYGIKQNLEKALKWFKLATEETPLRAYKGLSQVYYYMEDYEASYSYALKSAHMNDPEAQHNLGYMYESGLGINKDIDKARYWYQKSSDQGFALASNKLEGLSINSNN